MAAKAGPWAEAFLDSDELHSDVPESDELESNEEAVERPSAAPSPPSPPVYDSVDDLDLSADGPRPAACSGHLQDAQAGWLGYESR